MSFLQENQIKVDITTNKQSWQKLKHWMIFEN